MDCKSMNLIVDNFLQINTTPLNLRNIWDMKSHTNHFKSSYILVIAIIFPLNLQAAQSHPVKRSLSEIISKTEEETFRKTKEASTITPETKTELVKELEKLIKVVEGEPSREPGDDSCQDEVCRRLKNENAVLKKTEVLKDMMLKPAYPCDEWNEETRFCFLNRNVGNTVTFVLATPPPKTAGRVRVEWRQEFASGNSKRNRTVYHINPRDSPWNMVIGSGGHELRISPVTETDLDANLFTAVVHFQYGTPTRRLHFIIRKIPIDVGLVYPGAAISLHVPSFISLPSEGMTFKWTLNFGRGESLPSNMRPSPSGASLRIYELRKEQEGLVFCSIYTNLGLQAARVGFIIQRVESDNNKLVFIGTRPPHGRNSRRKRSPQVVNIPHYFKDPKESEEGVTNINTNAYILTRDRNYLITPRYMNKRQYDESPSIQEPHNNSLKEIGEVEVDNELIYATPKQNSYFGDIDWNEYERFEQEAMDAETQEPLPTRPLSFLERQKQSIRARLLEHDSKRDQETMVQEKRLHTTTEKIEFEEGSNMPLLQERDKLALLLGKCDSDSDCSLNAVCVKVKPGKPGFCRCLSEFEGNGIFCWEGEKWIV